MEAPEKLFFFKKNVSYTIGVRFHSRDVNGKSLNGNDPYVVVKESGLRDFKRANRRHLMDGLLIETQEPDLDMETPNAITDEQATEIVKNVFALKKALAAVTTDSAVLKLLEEAKFQDRPTKTIKLIEERLRELVGESPSDMQGAMWDNGPKDAR